MAESRPAQRVSKKQRDELRESMLAAGAPRRVIKDEMVRRWGLRPRQAWRHSYGWSLDTTAALFNSHNDVTGRAPMSGTRISAYERWPHSGERPTVAVLLSLAKLFETSLDQVVDGDDWAHLPDGDRRTIRDLVDVATGVPAGSSSSPPQPTTAYREGDDPDIEASQGEVVTMAAHEGSEHAEEAERRDIGEATLEQLRADVVRLSHEHMTADPFPTFLEMRRVRRRIYAALDRHLWPGDQTDLFFLLGVLNGLMAAAANGLGNPRAAEELVRAGWAYAVALGHHPLMGQLRLELANIAYWDRPRHSRDLARSGLEYLSQGPNAAQLHLRYGRATARLGEADSARRSIAAAHAARARDHHDDVLEIGGEFGLSRATQHFYAGSILLEIPRAEREAIAELERAVSLYAAGPEPGEHHYYGYVACANIDLASGLLRDGQLDAAASALEPVLSLPSDKRIEALLRRLGRVRADLMAETYQGQALAADLDERIETFCHETAVGDLGALPAGPG
jgi:hypothetical protein